MTPAPLVRAAGRDPATFAADLDDLAARHGTTRAAIIRGTIERLEEGIARDRATIDLLRRLEVEHPARTALLTDADQAEIVRRVMAEEGR